MKKRFLLILFVFVVLIGSIGISYGEREGRGKELKKAFEF